MGLLTRSPRTGSGRAVRTTAAVRAGWGAVLILLPGRVLFAGGDGPVPAVAATAGRVLGLRHLLQAAVTAAVPTVPVAGLGALVDTAHASSCLALAAWSPRWRRAALTDVLVEAVFAGAGWIIARRSP